MTIALLDINDSNLQLWSGDTHLQSPGYALLQERQYSFGTSARAAARLQPRDINTRYWWQMSTEALQPALGPARHTGDLVHAHLQDLHQQAGSPGELLLAVSGSMQRNQLALLLGIMQQCPFDAVGMVNRSVALASLYGGGGRLFHLEVQLHQAVIAELEESNGKVELQRTVPLPGCGLLQIQERLVEIIATAFIRQTRFDPRRKAATEQQLYDTLPDTLRALAQNNEANLDVNGYQARVNRNELMSAGQRLFDSAPEAMGVLRPDDRIIADPIAGLLPGLAERLPQMEVLATDSIRHALLQHQEQLVQRGQTLSFITALPCLEEKIVPRVEEPTEPAAQQAPLNTATIVTPTHLLQRSLARPLAAIDTALDGDWQLFHSGEGWQLRGSGAAPRVNNSDYRTGQVLACGDTITSDTNGEAVLIKVEQ
ncbi:MAG: hypothetical protein DRR04_01285 [Gammaproteobacteria bacterium]|nr:MAG: hypothetical protein DRQ97_04430 [Gammaproteobacteria bacterium]RLA62008.1 MAG: hypothetical protein DRR04_01285 [Gammaproteobacteria bacterium]